MHAANLGDDPEIAGLVAAHGAAFGVLDLLVVNAGMGYTDTLAQLPVARFDTVMKTNLRAPFLLIQGTLPLLRAGRRPFGGLAPEIPEFLSLVRLVRSRRAPAGESGTRRVRRSSLAFAFYPAGGRKVER